MPRPSVIAPLSVSPTVVKKFETAIDLICTVKVLAIVPSAAMSSSNIVPRTQMMTLSITMAQCSDPGGYIKSSQFKMRKPELDHVYPLVKLVTRTGKCAHIAHVGLAALKKGNR